MQVALFRTRIGPIISVLGSTLMVTGFSLPLFFTEPPSHTNFANPYPPVLNGWQVMRFLPGLSSDQYLSLTTVAPEIVLLFFLAVIILITSLLMLLREGSPLVIRTRALATFASIGMICCFYVLSIFLNWGGSPDGDAALPDITMGPGIQFLLIGAVLCAIGIGVASISAIIGAFLGLIIGYSTIYLPSVPGIGPLLNSLGFVAGAFPFITIIGFPLLGSILGGWIVTRRRKKPVTTLSNRRH